MVVPPQNKLVRLMAVPAILAVVLPLLAGCFDNGSAAFNDFINTLAGGASLPQLDPSTVTVRVINESGYNSTFEFMVDGVSQTITCTKTQKLCEQFLNPCPTTIEPVKQSLLDPTSGGFVGGTVFTGRPEYTFTRGQFECGDTILFQFSSAQITASVY